MKAILSLLITFSLISCQKEKSNKSSECEPLGNINIVVHKNDHKIDSIGIKNSNNKQKATIVKASADTLKFHINEPLNDLYKINFFSKKHISPLKIWLDGDHTIIDIEINRFAKVTHVTNSPIQDHIKEYSATLKELYKNPEENKEKINNFLLTEIKNNIKSPFIFSPAEIYYYSNINDQVKLQELDSLLQQIPSDLKNHKLSILPKLHKSLNN
ncbi:hypothetical protein [Mesonia aestuariivivens]|uniref:DUF4369 domain-containing protein n=1 Tax=Mesonia aestuariivivens TaxID=2796128 RepID=A0ABS6W2V6_9FLAO|nr:hypothetical protein [Mesonia aestuariivivens]MBW2962044.1 hypothetical protein [Mesonia aestuariivivens]